MSEPLLKIQNNHAAGCGDPPIIDSENFRGYIGYFASQVGDQWIFTREAATGRAILRGGDIGWNREFEVVDGMVPGIVLNDTEKLWLAACWAASRVIRRA